MASVSDLNILDLGSIFKSIADNRRTGTLRVRKGPDEKAVYFRAGQVQMVYTPVKTTFLGEALLRTGLLDETTLERAMIKQKASGEKLGTILVKLGKITEEDLVRTLQGQITEEVCELFTWRDIHCEFAVEPPPAHLFDPDPITDKVSLNAQALMVEAARRLDEWEAIRKTLPSFRDVPAVVKPPLAAPGSPQAELVACVDGVRDIEEVLAKVRLSKFVALKALRALFEQGAIRVKAPKELLDTARLLQESKREETRSTGVGKLIKLYERAEELGVRNPQVSLWLAKAYEQTKQKKQSVTRYLQLGRDSFEKGNLDEAVKLYRRILDLNPEDFATHEKLIDALMKKGDADAAANETRTLAGNLRKGGRVADALQAARRVAGQLAGKAPLLELVAELCFDSGDHIQALIEYEGVAQALTDSSDLAGAVRIYERMLEIDRENIDAHFRLAGALTQLGRTDEAVRQYKGLADLLSSSGVLQNSVNWQFLINVYEQIVSIEPNNPMAREWLADAYIAKKERDKAIAHLNELVRIHDEKHEMPALVAALRRVVELGPDYFRARRRLASALADLGDRGGAVRELRAFGETARSRGEAEIARGALLDAVALDPWDVDVHRLLGEIHADRGERGPAAAKFRELAHLCRAALRPADAATWFRRAAETDPGDPTSFGEAGELLASGGDGSRAAEAYRLQAERALSLDNVGDARRAVDRAAALAPDDPGLPRLRARLNGGAR
ncbi:MAG: tetratricopeptide repeat protein [Planctomycetales bacterium]|nr:tetratricopeptide repeat protein [Planctomycetales bacterium]